MVGILRSVLLARMLKTGRFRRIRYTRDFRRRARKRSERFSVHAFLLSNLIRKNCGYNRFVSNRKRAVNKNGLVFYLALVGSANVGPEPSCHSEFHAGCVAYLTQPGFVKLELFPSIGAKSTETGDEWHFWDTFRTLVYKRYPSQKRLACVRGLVTKVKWKTT